MAPLATGLLGALAILWLVRPPVTEAPARAFDAPAVSRLPAAPTAAAATAPKSERAEPAPTPEPPEEPAIVVRGDPLLGYRGALSWSDGDTRVRVEDVHVALLGGDFGRPLEGPPELTGRPTLVAVGAAWCEPCVAELGDLVALAERLHDAHGVGFIYASVDGAADPAGLELAVDALFLRARAHLPGWTGVEPPAWAEFRSDPKWAWAGLVAPLTAHDPGLRAATVPLLMLFDHCGHLRLVAQDRLDPNAVRAIVDEVGALGAAANDCGEIRQAR